jgi:predicted nucleotidyltransferase
MLQNMTRRIVEEFQPEKIILFGSYAYGQPEFHSDIDLLVVTNRHRRKSVFERDHLVAKVARPHCVGNEKNPLPFSCLKTLDNFKIIPYIKVVLLVNRAVLVLYLK